jgi:diguanylate cyclase (GGDEF)-like protein
MGEQVFGQLRVRAAASGARRAGSRSTTQNVPREGPTFALRLFLSFLVTLTLLGVVAYRLILHEARAAQIATYSATQQADAASFKAIAAGAGSKTVGIREIDEFLDVIAKRPGTLETSLIDEEELVVASGDDEHIGSRDIDPKIRAALVSGQSYAGRELSATFDRRNFEFVSPVNLPGGRYAYDVTYDNRAFDAQLSKVRKVLILVGLLVLVGGSGIFYLVGGRVLMRSHRLALKRATRDGLTDLPNQRAFHDEFAPAVANALRHDETLGLIVLDVDDFKFLNDRHGHQEGDALLGRVADVLRDHRPGDRVYRNGGDEFAVLLAHTDSGGALVFARRLHRAMSDAGVRISIGVSAQRAGQQSESLRSEAEAALSEAKRRGGNRYTHFDEIRATAMLTTLDQKAAVRRLIDERRVTTLFQPIWDLAAGKLLGIEALSRPDDSYNLSGPAEAFDLAEQIGRVHELDRVCVNAALTSVPALPPDAFLFLNICPHTLDLDEDRNDWLLEAVERAQLAPERVVVEVTERFGGRPHSVIKALTHLRAQGFKIAIDDIGTGNSGLEMLRTVNAEYVKLDGSIVSAAVTEPGARGVLMAMATFARQTGAYVIAEGIEDEETLAFLRSLDDLDVRPERIIQGGQGYRLGKPSPTVQVGTLQDLSASPLAA